MASLSSPESGIKAAAQPGIKNQARCAGRNQESRITGGGQYIARASATQRHIYIYKCAHTATPPSALA